MKRLLLLLALLALMPGCAYRNWSVMNNTRYNLAIAQDGNAVTNLVPGQSCIITQRIWMTYSSVSASAWSGGEYKGANSYTFYFGRPYIWQIDNVDRPGEAR